ncbi:ralA-binding protein 1 [Planococcus citri]|uniref:ralA-binding protein 1 n=1 Tax=Planococcus citri TaxID=170843 RepID=UPI0031FA0059
MEHIDFIVMYSADSNKKSNDSDYSDENHEKLSKKDLLIGKRKDKKDKGYATLEGESSPEEEVDTKSPGKARKTKSFKFSSKKEKREKSREKENKESEKKKDSDKDKDKKKDKDKLKIKLKDKKKPKGDHSVDISEELPIFGCPLGAAVQRDPCHDGVEIPLVIRNCIDYVQEHGLLAEGVYKVSGVKSRVQYVYGLYNKRKTVYESDFDLTIATSLLKQFLRSLPEPILTKEMLPKFEDVTLTKDAEGLKSFVEQLPGYNRALIKWLFIHFKNICSNEKVNKMNASLLGAIFCPLLDMSPRLFNSFLAWVDELFPDTVLTRYVPPMRCVSPNMPITLEAVTCELTKQESLLGQIHFEMNAGFISKEKEDQLWGVQRNITQLKRKLKSLEKEIQQKLKAQESTSSLQETDKDEEGETTANASDGSVSLVTEKLNENTRADTTPSVDESLDKQINYESSQENLNHPPSEDSDDETKALEFESEELISLMEAMQEEIKIERLKINQLKAELSAAKLDTSVNEYLSNLPDELIKDENNREAISEYNRLQIQQKILIHTIMEERESIVDLKVQIAMAQYKYKQANLH